MSRKSTNARIQRQDGLCTCCGLPLPKYKNNWGLVWACKNTGMCRTCLITIRTKIGFYAPGEAPPLPRKTKKS